MMNVFKQRNTKYKMQGNMIKKGHGETKFFHIKIVDKKRVWRNKALPHSLGSEKINFGWCMASSSY